MELNRLVPQLSAMQIALSAESFCAKTGSNLFCLMPSFFQFFFFFSFLLLLVPLPYRNVIICSPAAPLGNASDVPSFHLPPSPCALFVSLLQVYRHSYMASYSIYNIHTR